MGVRLRRAAGRTAALLLLSAAASMAAVLGAKAHFEGLGPPSTDAAPDAILVLGGSMERPPAPGSCHLVNDARLAWGLDLLRRHPGATLVYSDNLGGDPLLTRARILLNARAILGHEPERVVVEPWARSTFGNMRRSAPLIAGLGARRVAIVTDSVHMARALLLWRVFSDIPADAALTGGFDHLPLHRFLRYVLREAGAWWLNLGKLAGWEALALAGVEAEARARLIR